MYQTMQSHFLEALKIILSQKFSQGNIVSKSHFAHTLYKHFQKLSCSHALNRPKRKTFFQTFKQTSVCVTDWVLYLQIQTVLALGNWIFEACYLNTLSHTKIQRQTNDYGAPVEWYWKGQTEVPGEKHITVPLFPTWIPHPVAWQWTQASVWDGSKPTAWGMADKRSVCSWDTVYGTINATIRYARDDRHVCYEVRGEEPAILSSVILHVTI